MIVLSRLHAFSDLWTEKMNRSLSPNRIECRKEPNECGIMKLDFLFPECRPSYVIQMSFAINIIPMSGTRS